MSDQQNLMTCPEPLELIDGDGPERLAARQRLASHARGCARCGPQLQALYQADQLLARQLLGDLGAYSSGPSETVPGETCPAPDVLAAWIDGDRAGRDLGSHLAACASCREDLLAARDLEGVPDLAADPSEFQAPARSSRATLLLWTAVAAAAVVVVAAGAGFILGSRSPGAIEGTGSSGGVLISRGPDVPRAGQELRAGANPPVKDPQSQPAVERMTEPAQGPETELAVGPEAGPAVGPETGPAVGPETGPTVDPVTEPAAEPVTEPAAEPGTEPAVEPRRADSVEPSPMNLDDPVVAVTRVDVLGTMGIQFQRGDASPWQDLSAGQALITGDQLRASRSGGWIQVAVADVYLSPQARAAFASHLVLEKGGIWLDTTGRFVVSVDAGEVEVNGEAHVQGARGKLRIVVHTGVAVGRHHATGTQKKFGRGQSLSLTPKALGRVVQLQQLLRAPTWVRAFRTLVKPQDPGKSSGGARGGGGTRGRAGGGGGGRQMRSRAAGAGRRR